MDRQSRCLGIRKDGTRCVLILSTSSLYCHHHRIQSQQGNTPTAVIRSDGSNSGSGGNG